MHFELETGRPLASVDVAGFVDALIGAVRVVGEATFDLWRLGDNRPYKFDEELWSYELTRSRPSKLRGFGSKRAEAAYRDVASGRIKQLSFQVNAWGPGQEYGGNLAHVIAGFLPTRGGVSLIVPGFCEPVDAADPNGRHCLRVRAEGSLGAPPLTLSETPPVLLAAMVDLALAVGRFGAPLSGSAGLGIKGLRGRGGAYQHSVVPFGVDSYDWMVALPPQAVERLGGVDRVVAEAPVTFADVIESPDGPSVLCRVTEDPLLVTVEQRRAWRGYLAPVLPEKAPMSESPWGEVIHLTYGGFVLPEDIDWPGRDPAVFTVPWERSDG